MSQKEACIIFILSSPFIIQEGSEPNFVSLVWSRQEGGLYSIQQFEPQNALLWHVVSTVIYWLVGIPTWPNQRNFMHAVGNKALSSQTKKYVFLLVIFVVIIWKYKCKLKNETTNYV